ncbi:hypothetical protein BKA67DRAFT_572639 [Truncatella angustata]|uniref:Secreted protein n=1 Tax=Truncatella angustata TaxID=152316 RepID=A0A9P8UH42_9PEZI|nr:uncharacterized protein BKA67DRAFT_572639 [Truncatella angustata]KAH6651994.1 hypothetical protein BKA67DRAFT_572639 [Truncatella angustata]
MRKAKMSRQLTWRLFLVVSVCKSTARENPDHGGTISVSTMQGRFGLRGEMSYIQCWGLETGGNATSPHLLDDRSCSTSSSGMERITIHRASPLRDLW